MYQIPLKLNNSDFTCSCLFVPKVVLGTRDIKEHKLWQQYRMRRGVH